MRVGVDSMPRRAKHPTHEDPIEAVLAFWFERDVAPGYCEVRPLWFESTPEFDAEIAARFMSTYERAAAGALDGMADAAESCLALTIVLDQFPRCMFRGDERTYATDDKVLALAKQAIARGYDAALTPLQRWFLYMPFQHVEDRADQRRSVELFESLGADAVHRFVIGAARGHRDVVERFGRFPHRNDILGRVTTAEEAAFLASPEGSFWLA